MNHDCSVCQALHQRSHEMASRISHDMKWDAWMEELRRKGFAYLLQKIESHWKATGHLVDPVNVIIAIGKHALEVTAESRRKLVYGL